MSQEQGQGEPEKQKRGRKVIPGRRAHPKDDQAPERAKNLAKYAERIARGESAFSRDDEARSA